MIEVKKVLTMMLLGVLSASGCVYVTASPSVNGKAFVVQKKLLQSSFWNCDATGDTPTCWEVKNTPNGPVSAGGDSESSEMDEEPAAEPPSEDVEAEPASEGDESNE